MVLGVFGRVVRMEFVRHQRPLMPYLYTSSWAVGVNSYVALRQLLEAPLQPYRCHTMFRLALLHFHPDFNNPGVPCQPPRPPPSFCT